MRMIGQDIAELSNPERIGIGNCWSVYRSQRLKEQSCSMRTLTYLGYSGIALGPQVLYYFSMFEIIIREFDQTNLLSIIFTF